MVSPRALLGIRSRSQQGRHSFECQDQRTDLRAGVAEAQASRAGRGRANVQHHACRSHPPQISLIRSEHNETAKVLGYIDSAKVDTQVGVLLGPRLGQAPQPPSLFLQRPPLGTGLGGRATRVEGSATTPQGSMTEHKPQKHLKAGVVVEAQSSGCAWSLKSWTVLENDPCGKARAPGKPPGTRALPQSSQQFTKESRGRVFYPALTCLITGRKSISPLYKVKSSSLKPESRKAFLWR